MILVGKEVDIPIFHFHSKERNFLALQAGVAEHTGVDGLPISRRSLRMASTFMLPGTSIYFVILKLFVLGVITFPLITVTVEAAAFGESCSQNSECAGDLQQCSTNSSTCVCLPGHTEELQTCRLPLYGEVCNTVCDGFSCIGGVCSCSTSHYYDTTDKMCKTRKPAGDGCVDQGQCVGTLKCVSEPLKCGCDSDQYIEGGTTCQPKKAYLESCDGTASECSDLNADCITGKDNTKRCLCKDPYFRAADTNTCESKTLLQVSLIGEPTRTTDSIIFTWSTRSYDRTVYYIITNNPIHGTSSVSSNGGGFTGLQSGTKYTFTVTSYLNADDYYEQKSTEVSIGPFWTKMSHGDLCDGKDTECIDPNTDCINDKNNVKRCLCKNGYFRTSTTNTCQDLAALRVYFTGDPTRTTDSITFTWSANSYGRTVTYTIINTPSGGTPTDVTSSGGSVTGLASGTPYSISVVSNLAADQYHPLTSTFTIGTFWTKITYTESCAGKTTECSDPNTDCIDDNNNVKRCLCKNEYFRASTTNTCELLTELQISSPNVVRRTTDSITFTWSAKTFGRAVTYNMNNIPSGGTTSLSDSGGSVTGLTSGTQYSFFVQSSLAADEYYQAKQTMTINIAQSPWTIPAKPGSFDESSSLVKTNPMTFAFTPAVGKVDMYKVTLTYGTESPITKNSSTAQVDNLSLTLGVIYNYEIIAINGFKDESNVSSGSFKTASAAPSQVQNLGVTTIQTTSAVIDWKTPTDPNGEIHSFVVQVFEESSCVAAYVLKCNNCENETALTFPDCVQSKQGIPFDKDQVKFQQTISSLTVFSKYTVKVFAVNEAGSGNFKEEMFTTEDSGPEEVKALNVTSFRNSSTEKVGIQVEWTPGMKTGITNYTVTVVDENDTSNTQTITGYDNTKAEFPDLLAFHDYTVSVVAVTKKGSTNPIEKPIRTKTTTPGSIQNLKVVEDTTYATKMKLEFQCPSESERNGIISGFKVVKKSSSGLEEDYDITTTNCSGTISVPSTSLGKFEVDKSYTFTVIAKNQDYSSKPSAPKMFTVVTKPFIFESGKPGVREDTNTAPLQNSVTVSVCSSCITNPQQGEVTKAGLIVCVKSKTNLCSISRRKRSTAAFDNFKTWSLSKASEFKSKYRTTPDDWVMDLKTNAPSSFAIGDDKSCTKDTSIYCNGPLPSGTEIVVTVIACTVAGCQESQGFVVKTKAADSSDDNTGIIVGIIVPIIIIIIVVIAIVLYIRMRKKKQELPQHHQFVDLTTHESRAIKIRDFCDKVAVLHKDSNLLFQGEFEDIKALSSEFKFTCEEAQQEYNRVKNRYVDILPYDHTRVKLEISDGEDGSDFINANYIVGLTSQREYIATQGPMHATIPHFWRMVWEQKSKVIVMLSDLTENSKMKVSLYWPENLNEPISYGNVVVEMTNFSQLNKYIIRNFKISVGNMTRRVTHFFIPGWWDFSANLTFDDVLEFAQLVRKETTPPGSGPPIVHCSAGVGRTGTFIALDYFMQYIEKHSLDDDIDVFTYVLDMRKCRPRMVQAETQYIFIFDALVEVIKRKIKFEKERLYDNGKGEENVYANQGVMENVYANQMVTENPYANTSFGDAGSPGNETTTIDFSYSNKAFEPDNFESVDLSSNDPPTTVL